jgi:hypothetical protein
VTNNTAIVVNDFFVEGYATITGDGSMDLNGAGINVPSGGYGGQFVGTPGFVNDVNHTIQGPGTINSSLSSTRLVFDNRGMIETAEGTLQINLRVASQMPNSMAQTVNSGTIRAKTGGQVAISGSSNSDVLNNSAGTTMGVVEAGVDSTILLGNMTLRGGILRAVAPPEGSTAQAGKILRTENGPLLEDLRIEGKIGDTLANSGFGLAGTIENTGVMTPGFTIFKPTTLTGGGEIHLQFPSGIFGNRTFFDGFYDPLVNENNLIRGTGWIGDGLAFTNRGVVQADVAGGQLVIVASNPDQPLQYPGAHWNSGVLQAINGGDLSITAAIVNYEGGVLGTIHAGDGSEVRVSKIIGGILSTAGSGKIITTHASPPSYLADIHNQGALVIGAAMEARGRVVNDGTVSQTSGHVVYVGGPFTELAGSGTWGTSNVTLAFEVGTNLPSGGFFVHGAEHTIQGGGTINVARGTFINRGTVIANGTTSLTIALAQGATMQQQGTLRSIGSPGLEVAINDDRFTNRGLIEATGFFALKRLNPGPVELVNAPGAQIDMNSTLSVSAPLSLPTDSVSLWNQEGALFTGGGKLNLIQTGINNGGLFRNSGILRPESHSFASGRIFLDGNFWQESTGRLELDLSGAPGTGMFDYLRVTDGDATLGGALDISLANGFGPAIGDSFEILSVANGIVSGGFDTFTAPALSGRWWNLQYLADKVLLSVEAITADFDHNGVVNGDDLDEWQTAFGVDAAADADGDGDSDGRDFLAWQRQLGSGVPHVLGVAVPEPSGILLAVVSSLLIFNPCIRRQR